MENALDSHAAGEAETEHCRMIRLAETDEHRRKERTGHSQQKRERKGRRTGSGDEGRTMLCFICIYMHVCMYLCMCAYVDVGPAAGLYDGGDVGGGGWTMRAYTGWQDSCVHLLPRGPEGLLGALG